MEVGWYRVRDGVGSGGDEMQKMTLTSAAVWCIFASVNPDRRLGLVKG